MRIIAGQHRGRRLIGPEDASTTRPITDRVKEALFSRLVSLGLLPPGRDENEPPARVVDIFSGTGSMGLECLSRGAEHCLFLDTDRDAGRRLQQNLETLRLTEQATLRQTSALSPAWVGSLEAHSLAVVFLDPPYAMAEDRATRDLLHQLLANLGPKLEPGGVIVYRTPRSDAAGENALAQPVADLDGPTTYDYGSMSLHFYQAPLPDEGDPA